MPSFVDSLRRAASILKDAQFQKDGLDGDSVGEMRRVLASIDRAQNRLPEALKPNLSQLKEIEKQVFEGSNSSLLDLYTHMLIVSDTLQELVQEWRVSARHG